jgi:hypothetical protein
VTSRRVNRRARVPRGAVVFGLGWCTAAIGLALLVAAIAGELAGVGTVMLALGLGLAFLGWAMSDEEVGPV